jgi:hypothetical protein
MLDDRDRLVLAPGVRLEEGFLHDDVRGLRVPTNEAASLVLTRHGETLAEAAGALSRAFMLPRERARDDVLAFAWQLNRAAFANVSRSGLLRGWGAWLVLALRLLPSGSVPSARVTRRAIDTGGVAASLVSVIRGLWRWGAVAAAATVLAVLQAAAVAGRAPVTAALAAGAGVALGVMVHEAAHTLPLIGKSTAALVVTPLRISVVHPALTLPRRALVAAAGPLVTALLGLGLVWGGSLVGWTAIMFCGGPLVGHALGLSVLSVDGRTACAS